jgi:drug/metabolite transporter (DMT)-like permease
LGRVYGLLLLMTLLWGVNYVAAKIALRHFPALLFSPLRILVAGALLFPLFAWQASHRPAWASWPRRDELPRLVMLGLFGVALNQILFILGMQRTSAAHAALVFTTLPMQVLLMAAWRGHERVRKAKLAGMAVAAGGVAVLNLAPGAEASGASSLGDLLIFGAALCFAFFTVGSKEATQGHGGLTVTTFAHLASMAGVLPLALGTGWNFAWSAVPAEGWLTLAYMALFPSMVCYLIFYYALNYVPASRVASFSYLQPLISAVSALYVLSEPITASLILGGALILSGVWISQRF